MKRRRYHYSHESREFNAAGFPGSSKALRAVPAMLQG